MTSKLIAKAGATAWRRESLTCSEVTGRDDAPPPKRLGGRCTLCFMSKGKVALGLPIAALAGLATHDLLQRKHSLLRAFPVIGHARYFIEKVGPEMRQYVVAGNDEERPFSRDQRTYIYRPRRASTPTSASARTITSSSSRVTRSSSTAPSSMTRPPITAARHGCRLRRSSVAHEGASTRFVRTRWSMSRR